MLLTSRAEYALRALAVLAVEPLDRWVPVQELAERAHVPPAFLSKVMRRLVLAGLVSGVKGHGGGFRLAREPARIRVAEVLRAIDSDTTADHCAFGWQRCSEVRPCPLHGMYGVLKASFRQWSERCTLADVQGSAFGPSSRATRPRRARP